MQFINNQFLTAHGASFSSYNPATGQSIWSGNSASEEDIDTALLSSTQAQVTFNKLTFAERLRYLEQFNIHLNNEKNKFAEIISIETGKPLWESLQEINSMQAKLKITVEAINERCKTTDTLLHRPLGVVAIFGPFNLPAHLVHGHMVPALLLGNTVLFKPSERTPLIGEELMKIWQKTNLPDGVINMLQGGALVGQHISNHKEIQGLFFTGSYTTGSRLAKLFGATPEKMLALEMGGNNPLVVWDTKNVEAAIYLIIQSAFITSGQRCTCARRLILKNDKAGDAILTSLIKAIETIHIGAYTETPEPFMGPLIDRETVDLLLKAQDDLKKRNGNILKEMTLLDSQGTFLSPGVIDVTEAIERIDEEFFGPLLQVIRVETYEEAIKEANNTKYGLSAGLISDNKKYFKQFLKEVKAGLINFNAPLTGASSQSPFGGIGQSGNHRPSAYYAADYCCYPCASIIYEKPSIPDNRPPGLKYKESL